jgi:dolichol kinase
LCATRIGYNPDFLLAYKSDAVVRGDLTEILPFITTDKAETRSVTRRDLIRESIHFSGLLVPVVTLYLSLNHYFIAFIIFLVTLTYIASELSRIYGVNIPMISTITWKAAIQPEIYEFVTAPISFAAGIALTLLIFPPPVSYAAIAVFTVGDVSATLFGKGLGRHTIPYNKGKKIEGTLFGILFASLGAYLFTLNPLKAVIAAAVGMTVESLPSPINDNLTIPIAAGITLLLLP